MNIHVKWRRHDENTFKARVALTAFTPQKEMGDPTPATRSKAERNLTDFLYGEALAVYSELRAYTLARVKRGEDNYALDLLDRLVKAINPTFSHELSDKLPEPTPENSNDWHNTEMRKLIEGNTRMFYRAILKKLPEFNLAAIAMQEAGMTQGDIAIRFLVSHLVDDEACKQAFMQEFIVINMNDPHLGPLIHYLVNEVNKPSSRE